MADNLLTRRCTDCGKDYTGPTRRGRCNPCRNRAEYHQDIDKSRAKANQRARYLKHKYGLDVSSYAAMLEAQGGVCAVCGGDQPGYGRQRFHVDHDHSCCAGSKSCGKCIRGLLCGGCNVGLAQFRDNPETLERAAAYLRTDCHS
jgi:hypothetical protein